MYLKIIKWKILEMFIRDSDSFWWVFYDIGGLYHKKNIIYNK